MRFVEDNWEAPTLGAWGVGWEVWLDGLEITQFTYLQQAGGIDLAPVSIEITYGLDRIANFLQGRSNVFELDWSDTIKYGQLHQRAEKEFSIYSFQEANLELLFQLFNQFEEECRKLLEKQLIMPAYDFILKLSHIFNLIDARGGISVSERVRLIGRVRELARKCAQLYLESKVEGSK